MGDTDPIIDAAEPANSDSEESGTEEVNPSQELDSYWEARFAKLESALLGALTDKASQPEERHSGPGKTCLKARF